MTYNSPEFKRAAIDFVLTHGTCDSMMTSTRTSLAALAFHGVDYERSGMPDFKMVDLDPGDTFNEATYGEAYACDVYCNGADPKNMYDVHTFHIADDDMKRLLVSQMIMGVLAAAQAGQAGWLARADEREIERLTRIASAEAARKKDR